MAILLVGSAASAGEGSEAPKADRAVKARLEMMQEVIDDFQVRSAQIESPAALRFRQHPLLRYNDQTRPGAGGAQALLDATAWRLGEHGRPLAVVTLEVYPDSEKTAV
ncbi:MAG TPA: hypothetical protein VFW87_08165, partial [Pirellulales bacterium]|nr:hypothetical protein [Pirellulales bacterium]